MKLFKRIIITLLVLLAIMVIGLIANNRFFYAKYHNVDIRQSNLSEKDLQRAHEVYIYLKAEGSNLFSGFDGKSLNLILFNEAYEFLLCDFQPSDSKWEYIGDADHLNKGIYRRTAENPLAFTVKVDDVWVGSFASMDTYNKQIINEMPVFFPPQLIMADESFYQALVIHEMVHAYQGTLNTTRVDTSEHIHNVCRTYYSDNQFNTLIEQEALYLEQAFQATDRNVIIQNVQSFLNTRSQRRQLCQMNENDIHEEKEMEWLEGLARYAEYSTSRDSSSPIAKGLTDITEKVKTKNDDRYYALGMAEYMIILKLDENSEEIVLHENVALEDLLITLCEN